MNSGTFISALLMASTMSLWAQLSLLLMPDTPNRDLTIS